MLRTNIRQKCCKYF